MGIADSLMDKIDKNEKIRLGQRIKGLRNGLLKNGQEEAYIMNTARRLESRFSLVSLFLCLILGILSQIESIQATFRPVMYASWMAVIIIYVIQFRHKLLVSNHAILLVVMTVIIFLWRVTLIVFRIVDALPQIGTMLMIDLAAFLYGSWLAEGDIDNSSMAKMLIGYSVACVAFSIYLFRTYFTSITDWITTTHYQYTSKNSAAQLLVHAIFFLLFLYPVVYRRKSIVKRMLHLGMVGMMLVVISLLRCRTAMLALAVGAIYYVLRFGKKKRITYIVLFVTALTTVLMIPPIRQFLESALLLNKYDQNATLNQFSSGRLASIEAVIRTWMEHPWLGVGQILVDCNPIAILADSGIFGAIPYFVFWFSTVKMNLVRKGSAPFNKVTQMLTVYYCVTSLLEGYPPFGPGVCVAPLWLLSGYMELKYGGGKNNEVISAGNSHYTNI